MTFHGGSLSNTLTLLRFQNPSISNCVIKQVKKIRLSLYSSINTGGQRVKIFVRDSSKTLFDSFVKFVSQWQPLRVL